MVSRRSWQRFEQRLSARQPLCRISVISGREGFKQREEQAQRPQGRSSEMARKLAAGKVQEGNQTVDER